jgi:hypothetical protein
VVSALNPRDFAREISAGNLRISPGLPGAKIILTPNLLAIYLAMSMTLVFIPEAKFMAWPDRLGFITTSSRAVTRSDMCM